MLKDEEQAKLIRCCGPEGCGAVNDHGARFCIAASCMGWRWFDPEKEELFCIPGRTPLRKDQVRYPLAGLDQSGSWKFVKVEHRRGYCGYAGVPQHG